MPAYRPPAISGEPSYARTPAVWQGGAGERQQFTMTGQALAVTAAFLPALPRRHRSVALSRCGPPATGGEGGAAWAGGGASMPA